MKPRALDKAIDDDYDDTTPPPETAGATSAPYKPGAAYHSGEEHELSTLSQEQSGVVHGPGEPAWNALKGLYPDARATDLEAFIEPKTQRLKVKMSGSNKPSFYLYTTNRQTNKQQFNPKIMQEIITALGKSRMKQAVELHQERDRIVQEIQEKTQTKQQLEEVGQEVQTLRPEMDTFREQIRQLDNDIRELEDRTGPLDEETIQELKDEKRALEAEHQRKREQYLKLANRDIERRINKLGIKVRKSLEELEQEKAALEKQRDEGQRVLDDANTSPSEKEAAKKQVDKVNRDLEKVNEDMEREEEKLPLRERV